MKWFDRDPALLVSGVVAAIVAIVALFPLSQQVNTAVAMLATALGGLVVAAWVNRDGQVPAILGFIKAGMYLGLTLGWSLTETQQTLILVAAEAVFSLLFIRPNVEAKLDASFNPRSVYPPVA